MPENCSQSEFAATLWISESLSERLRSSMEKSSIQTLVGSKLLIVAPAGETRAQLAGAFRGIGCHALVVGDETQAIRTLQSNLKIDGILLEVEPPISCSFQFVRYVRSHVTEAPPVFLVTDRIDPHFDNAFFEGVEAIFVKPLMPDEVLRGVAYSSDTLLAQPIRNHRRKRIRRARVSYSVDSKNVLGYATNIGSGGMFIGSMDRLPSANQKIKFVLLSENSKAAEVCGVAIVKWLRPKIEHGRPRGFGVEFTELDQDTVKVVSELSESSDPSARR